MKEYKQRSIRGTRRRKPGWRRCKRFLQNGMKEEEDVLPEAIGSIKLRRDEISRGRRKRRKEDNIWPEKQGHLPTVSQRIQNPEEFYSEDWDKVQQEEDE